MRIDLIHFYSDRNIGDAAIAAGLSRLAAASGYDARVADAAPSSQPDARVSVGGDIFNNGRPWLITRRFLEKLRGFDCDPQKTFVFGQSIPPSCRGLALRLLAQRLRRLSGVYVRDLVSANRLCARGVAAQTTVDAAFALTVGDADVASARSRFAALGIADPERVALLSLRGFNRMYPADEDLFLSRMSELARRFVAAGLTPVVLLHADVDAADSDAVGARRVCAQVPQTRVFDVFSAHERPDWRAAFGAIACAGLVVGPRYHMAVLRLAAGRAPFSLWYANKGADLRARFNVPGAAADDFDPGATAARCLAIRDQKFDAAPLRAQVYADFSAALRKAGAAPLRAAA